MHYTIKLFSSRMNVAAASFYWRCDEGVTSYWIQSALCWGWRLIFLYFFSSFFSLICSVNYLWWKYFRQLIKAALKITVILQSLIIYNRFHSHKFSVLYKAAQQQINYKLNKNQHPSHTPWKDVSSFGATSFKWNNLTPVIYPRWRLFLWFGEFLPVLV